MAHPSERYGLRFRTTPLTKKPSKRPTSAQLHAGGRAAASAWYVNHRDTVRLSVGSNPLPYVAGWNGRMREIEAEAGLPSQEHVGDFRIALQAYAGTVLR